MQVVPHFIVALMLCCSQLKGPNSSSPSADRIGTPLERTRVDKDAWGILAEMKQSRQVFAKVVGRESLTNTSPLLYKIARGIYETKHLETVKAMTRRALIASKRYDAKSEIRMDPRVFIGTKTRVVWLQMEFPGLAVSPKEEKDKLIVQVCVCPDRLTCLALRSAYATGVGGQLEKGLDVGEWIGFYGLQNNFQHAHIRCEPGIGADKFVMLRANLLIQVYTCTYLLRAERREAVWLSGGMSESDLKEMSRFLLSMDKDLKLMIEKRYKTKNKPVRK
jgi:hypothetical protein